MTDNTEICSFCDGKVIFNKDDETKGRYIIPYHFREGFWACEQCCENAKKEGAYMLLIEGFINKKQVELYKKGYLKPPHIVNIINKNE